MKLEELKRLAESGELTLKQKQQIPTPEDYKMALMLKEYLNTPILFEDVPEHLMWTEKDPYAKFRRTTCPYRVNKSKFKALKIAKRPDSPIQSMYAARNGKAVDAYIKFAALPNEVRDKVYGYHTMIDYAKDNGISRKVLEYWGKDEVVLNRIRAERIRFFDRKTSEVIYAFYKKTIRNADAHRVNLWLTKIAGLKDETVVDNKLTIEWKPSETTANIIELVQQNDSDTLSLPEQNDHLLESENTMSDTIMFN